MFDHLHWLPLTARVQLKILSLIYRSCTGQAPKYLCDLIRLPASATSLRPLRSLNRHDLFVLRARTSMAKTRAFAFIGPALWNQLPPLTRSCLLTGGPSASFRCLKTSFFSLGLSHWRKHLLNFMVCTRKDYKLLDTIREYNTIQYNSNTIQYNTRGYEFILRSLYKNIY